MRKNDNEDKILKMILDGETNKSIANIVGLAENTITYYRKKLGVSRSYGNIDWKHVQKLHDNGMNKEDIAKELNVSVRTISKGIHDRKFSYKRKYKYKYGQRTLKHSDSKKNICIFCKNKTSAAKFCSVKCQTDFEYNKSISDWKDKKLLGHTGVSFGIKSFVRRYILEKYNYKCSECGFSGVNRKTKRSIIQIDHIDGDPGNTVEENLRALCPNCHAMTETFMALNVNNSSNRRRKKKDK